MRTLKFFLIALVVFALVLVPALVVLADEGAPPGPPDVDITSPLSIANFILAGGLGIAVSAVLDRLLGAWFHRLESNAKFWLVLGAYVGFALVAQLVTHLYNSFPATPGEVWGAYGTTLIYGLTAWAAAISAHPATKDQALRSPAGRRL